MNRSAGRAPDYISRLLPAIARMCESQVDRIGAAGEFIAEAVARGGMMHTFGCGHSALVAAEVSYRSGGLAPVNFLGLLPGPAGWIEATGVESDAAPAGRLVAGGNVGAGDAVAVISHSGSSSLVLAVDDEAQRRGAALIAVTSTSSTPLGSRAAVVLETGAPHSDCALRRGSTSYGSMSSILASILLNAAIAEAVGLLLRTGLEPPVLSSVHVVGGRQHNAAVARLLPRVPCWSQMTTVLQERA